MTAKENIHVEIGKKLKEYRKRSKDTLRTAEEKTGISFSLIARHERGERALSALVFAKLAKAYDMTYAEKAAIYNKLGDVISYEDYYEAELSMMVVELVQSSGVKLDSIKRIQPMPSTKTTRTCRIDLKDGSDVTVSVGIKK